MEILKATVLVVDDKEEMLRLCVRVLRGVCSEVETAASCAAARAAFRKKHFDLVLSDINIEKDGDGIALIGEFKALVPSTAVIIMTGDPTLETAMGGLKTGALEYIIKPFSPEYLESVVRHVFEKSKLFSELEREKALHREVEAAYTHLRESERLKDAFLGRLNHELRTPLAIAAASMELLGAELKGEKARELWERGGKALCGLKLIVEELLLFSGLLKGGIRIKKEPCDLRPVLQAAARGLDFLYGELGVSLALSVEGDPLPVSSDPELMAAVFKQLLSNAAKFSPRGGSVSVRAVYNTDKAVFHFTDAGCGVSDGDMPRIFDGFFQAAEYLTRSVGGIGLGLATVKHIVDAHGGSVTARKNTPGPGLTFTVTLPLPAKGPDPGGSGPAAVT